MKDRPGGVLVIRGGAIGDFILTLPVLTALRRRFPDSRLEFLGSPQVLDLATTQGLADGARSLDSRALADFFVRDGLLDSGWKQYFSCFSIVVSYLHDPEGVFQENIAAGGAAEFIVGPHRLEDGSHRHATQVLLQPLEQLAISSLDPVPHLPVAGLPDVRLPPGRWIALHPGSGSERKNWSEENWRALVTEITTTTDLNLLLVGGEVEGSRLERLAALIPGERCRLTRSLPLPVVAAHLSRCRGFIGHDSGISHLAAAVGVPGIILWGPTDLEVWRPLGRSISIVRSQDGIGGITRSEVFERVRRLLHVDPA